MKNKKSLGQHWLKERGILDEIADLAAAGGVSRKVCLEIGPGLGFLTAALLRRFKRVLAVEFDADLARKLPGSFPGTNLEVVNADILEFDLGQITENYTVAGNIPYYITSPIVRKLLMTETRPERIVLLVQKEVAERLAAGKGERGWLSVFAQNKAEVTLGPVVGGEWFTPPPKVDSQVVVLVPREKDLVSEEAMRLAKIGFATPRKKLAGVLADFYKIDKEVLRGRLREIGVGEDARPGDLEVEDWGRLLAVL